MNEQYIISKKLKIRGIINGTYPKRIPHHLREEWQNLVEKNNGDEPLTDEEIDFLKIINSITCHSKHQQDKY